MKRVTLKLTCDWSKATAPPVLALKWLLKRLGRVFNVVVVACKIEDES